MAELDKGNYFGEIALLEDTVRQATVVVGDEPAVCLQLDRGAFNDILGSLLEILGKKVARQVLEYVKKLRWLG